jgi:hypothetical protein
VRTAEAVIACGAGHGRTIGGISKTTKNANSKQTDSPGSGEKGRRRAMIIVVHDNGIPGQRGCTEEAGTSEDVERIKARYTQAGITIYSIDAIAE